MANQEIVERFEAVNADGDVYEVVKWQAIIRSPTTTSIGIGRGSCVYKLATGEHVNPKSDDGKLFEILWLDREENELITRT